MPRDHPDGNHLLRGEVWVAEWLRRQVGEIDCCTDVDLHRGEPSLTGVRLIVLQTHPEYWSRKMYLRLRRFLRSGGSLLYLGGNGIYRMVQFGAGQRAFRTAYLYSAELFRRQGLGERSLLGVAYDGAGADSTYTADLGDPDLGGAGSHWLFRGTGLRAGNEFGGSAGLKKAGIRQSPAPLRAYW